MFINLFFVFFWFYLFVNVYKSYYSGCSNLNKAQLLNTIQNMLFFNIICVFALVLLVVFTQFNVKVIVIIWANSNVGALNFARIFAATA